MLFTNSKTAKAKKLASVRSRTGVASRLLAFAHTVPVSLSLQLLAINTAFSQTVSEQPPVVAAVHEAVPHATELASFESLPTDFTPQTYDASTIGQIAASSSSTANLIRGQSKATSIRRSILTSHRDSSQRITQSLARAAEYRQRQTSAATAMKLHYGIAAASSGQSIIQDLNEFISLQKVVQERLVGKGIPIRDPLMLQRIEIQSADKQLELESQEKQLRIQLSQLVGTAIACRYVPDEIMDLTPSDIDLCEKIEMAMRCRCDLIVLERLRANVSEESLDAWDQVAAQSLGLPRASIASHLTSAAWHKLFNRDAIEHAVSARRHWLDQLIQERRKQIVNEVELAYERKRSAALRWAKAREQNALWHTRIEQLQRIGESQGNLDQQIEAQFSELQSRPDSVERWLEWQQANVDLLLAIGCDMTPES